MNRIKKELQDKSGLELAEICARAGDKNKGEDIVIMDVRGISTYTDFFVIMSGRSSRHVQGLAEAIGDELNAKRVSSQHSEGLEEGHWVLLDYYDVVVHIFYKEQRKFYDLEGLWHDAPRISLAELADYKKNNEPEKR